MKKQGLPSRRIQRDDAASADYTMTNGAWAHTQFLNTY
jgi:hypothetical protein